MKLLSVWRRVSCPTGVGGVFLAAGVTKLLFRPVNATDLIGIYSGNDGKLIHALVGLEIVLGVLLITRVAVRAVAFCALAMLSAFSGTLAVELFQPRPVQCGCLVLPSSLSLEGLIGPHVRIVLGLSFNLVLMLGVICSAQSREKQQGCERSAARRIVAE